jgi:hypothetical protein
MNNVKTQVLFAAMLLITGAVVTARRTARNGSFINIVGSFARHPPPTARCATSDCSGTRRSLVPALSIEGRTGDERRAGELVRARRRSCGRRRTWITADRRGASLTLCCRRCRLTVVMQFLGLYRASAVMRP